MSSANTSTHTNDGGDAPHVGAGVRYGGARANDHANDRERAHVNDHGSAHANDDHDAVLELLPN